MKIDEGSIMYNYVDNRRVQVVQRGDSVRKEGLRDESDYHYKHI